MQAVQSSHAIVDFILKYPAEAHKWHKDSNYIVQLSVGTEKELEELATTAEAKGITVVRFFEPDLDNALTAICMEPAELTRKITSSLPLMLKEIKPAEVFKKVA